METAQKDPEASCREIRDFLAVHPKTIGSGALKTLKTSLKLLVLLFSGIWMLLVYRYTNVVRVASF